MVTYGKIAWISWERDMNHIQYLEQLAAASEASEWHVIFDDIFLHSFCGLDDEIATQTILTYFSQSPTVDLHMQEYGLTPDNGIIPGRTHHPATITRMQRLFTSLGANSKLKSARVASYGRRNLRLARGSIQCLQQITRLCIWSTIHANEASIESFGRDLASELTGHSSLQHVTLYLPETLFRIVLPVLQSMPCLTSASMHGCARPMAVIDAQAITDLLCAGGLGYGFFRFSVLSFSADAL
jgi:hypothetical protein